MRVVSLHVGDVDLSCAIMVSLNGRSDQRRLAAQNVGLTNCYYLVALFPSKTNIRTNAKKTEKQFPEICSVTGVFIMHQARNILVTIPRHVSA